MTFSIFFILAVAFAAAGPTLDTHVRPVLSAPINRDARQCDCFVVSGPNPGYFQHYKMWDFRSVPLRMFANSTSSTWQDEDQDDEDDWGWDSEWDWDDWVDYDDDSEEPKVNITSTIGEGESPDPDSWLFFETPFEKDWSSQGWERHRTKESPVSMINSKRNVFFTKDHERGNNLTYLVLRTTRHTNYTSTAEIETRISNIYHASIRVRLRLLPASMTIPQPVQPKDWPPLDPRQHAIPALNNASDSVQDGRPAPGACVGIFTYHDLNTESDIEILTKDTSYRVHYANQPDYDPVADIMIPGASSEIDLPFAWTSWSTHRLDWLPSISRMYVDNRLQDAKSYRVPNLQSMVIINLWSDGGDWTGDMRLGDSIYMGIEWIELAYNTSSGRNKRVRVPASQRHGGHQPFPPANLSNNTGNEHPTNSTLSPNESADELSKKKKKPRKCKKGRKGRKCRRRRKHRKDHDHDGEDPRPDSCRRPCAIDSL